MFFSKNRRRLLTRIPLVGAASMLAGAAFSSPAKVDQDIDNERPLDGHLCAPIYNAHMFPLEGDNKSVLAVIDTQTGSYKYVHSPVPTLHGLIRPLQDNPNKQTLGIGQDSPELIDIFDHQFDRISTLTFTGIRFRGHGIVHPEGILVMAEHLDRPEQGGLMLLLSSNGRLIKQVPTGGLRPHQIIDCGAYYAVAHYGDLPRRSEDRLINEIVNPGVSFIDKETLAFHDFVALPNLGLAGHLAIDADDQVNVLVSHSMRVDTLASLHALAEHEDTILLASELGQLRYRKHYPLYKIDSSSHAYTEDDHPARLMRRGQSIDFDTDTHVLTATYAASQTILVKEAGKPVQFIDTLPLGVAVPRGCVVLKGHGLIAISGEGAGVAILDPITRNVKRFYGISLGGHSHLFWFDTMA